MSYPTEGKNMATSDYSIYAEDCGKSCDLFLGSTYLF